MSKDKLQRRKFLADVLFAGGGLTAAALLAKMATSEGGTGCDPGGVPGLVAHPDPDTPDGTATPSHCGPGKLDGDVQAPEPQLGGKPMPPQRLEGDFEAPVHDQKPPCP